MKVGTEQRAGGVDSREGRERRSDGRDVRG